MTKAYIMWAVGLLLPGASGATVSANSGLSIVVPMLLDFQPVVVPLDPTSDVHKKLLQFCVDHLLDIERCHVLEDAVADVMRLEKGGQAWPCRPSEMPLAPSFALVKNLLVAVDSSEQRPSFQWLEDSSDHIATDICSFLAESHAAVDVSAEGCVEPLAAAITLSFQWLNAIPACDVHAAKARPSIRLQSAGRKGLANRIREAEKPTTPMATTMTRSASDYTITITPLQLVDSHEEIPLSEVDDAVEDDKDQARAEDRPIRITPIIDSSEAIELPPTMEATSDESQQADVFMADALVFVALFAVVMMAQWLRVLLIAQHKSIEVDGESVRGGNVVTPLDVGTEQLPPSSERTFQHGLAILRRVNERSLSRMAMRRWRAASQAREVLTVETDPRLIGDSTRPDPTESPAETDLSAAVGTPRSSAAHKCAPPFSLVAMSLLMPPCSPMTTSSPTSSRAESDTPLARVTRLLEAESSTTELLDQFEAARLAAEHQSAAARRIQRAWRSWRSSSSSDTRDGAKQSHRLPHRASQLLRQVRRLQSHFSNPREDLVGQSASSA